MLQVYQQMMRGELRMQIDEYQLHGGVWDCIVVQ